MISMYEESLNQIGSILYRVPGNNAALYPTFYLLLRSALILFLTSLCCFLSSKLNSLLSRIEGSFPFKSNHDFEVTFILLLKFSSLNLRLFIPKRMEITI